MTRDQREAIETLIALAKDRIRIIDKEWGCGHTYEQALLLGSVDCDVHDDADGLAHIIEAVATYAGHPDGLTTDIRDSWASLPGELGGHDAYDNRAAEQFDSWLASVRSAAQRDGFEAAARRLRSSARSARAAAKTATDERAVASLHGKATAYAEAANQVAQIRPEEP